MICKYINVHSYSDNIVYYRNPALCQVTLNLSLKEDFASLEKTVSCILNKYLSTEFTVQDHRISLLYLKDSRYCDVSALICIYIYEKGAVFQLFLLTFPLLVVLFCRILSFYLSSEISGANLDLKGDILVFLDSQSS